MNNMKGLASIDSSSPYTRQNLTFKHISLMQDYGELQKETQAKRERLERMRKKKITLMAEVGFLRRRYRFLTKNQSQKRQHEKGLLPPQFAEPKGKNIMNGRNFSGKGTFLRHQTPVADFDRRKKVPSLSNGKEPAFRPPVPVFDLAQKGRAYSGNGATVRNTAPVLDLNQTEMINVENEAAVQNVTPVNQTERINVENESPVRNVTPVFDLNQVMTEEEELQENYEPLPTDKLWNGSVRGASDEQQLQSMKLSLYRNKGDDSSHAGQRKISWQDQVPLRV